MGAAALLFINALSANIEGARYEPAAAQQLIAQRLDLPLAAVSRAWVEIDMSVVLEMAGGAQGLPEMAEALLGGAAQRLGLHTNQLHCVVVLPAVGHVSALGRLLIEAVRLTGQQLAAVIVLWREESGALRLFHVIPEPDRDEEFAAALQHT